MGCRPACHCCSQKIAAWISECICNRSVSGNVLPVLIIMTACTGVSVLRGLPSAVMIHPVTLPCAMSRPAASKRETEGGAGDRRPIGDEGGLAGRPEERRATAGGGGGGGERYQYSDPVNRLLGNFLPPARDVEAELAGQVDFGAPKASGMTLAALAERVERRLAESEWFVTGVVDAAVFAEGFEFKDDSVATKGIRSYALGVRKLFDQASGGDARKRAGASVIPEEEGDTNRLPRALLTCFTSSHDAYCTVDLSLPLLKLCSSHPF